VRRKDPDEGVHQVNSLRLDVCDPLGSLCRRCFKYKKALILVGAFLYYLSPVFALRDLEKVEPKGLNRGAIFEQQGYFRKEFTPALFYVMERGKLGGGGFNLKV